MLTADGFSIPNRITGAGMNREVLQKIFPLTGVPIATAHHGINMLHGRKVGQLIADFEKTLGDDLQEYPVRIIAEKLRDYADSDAKKTLGNPENQGVIGFWITGFSQTSSKPEFYEN